MESREIKTCRGIVNYLEESATKNGGDINKALGLLHNSFFLYHGPYFTNNFFGHLLGGEFEGISRYRKKYADKIGAEHEWHKIWSRLDELTEKRDILASEDLHIWQGRKLIYPYYITLKREGFDGNKLMG